MTWLLRIALGFAAALLWIAASPAAATAVAAGEALTSDRLRITDEAIARDLATIDAVTRRIAAFDTAQAPGRAYTRTLAASWAALARDQYRLNDRSGLAEAALARATALASRLEAGGTWLDSTPSDLPGAPGLRRELRALADSLRGSSSLRCVAEPLARFEVELVRAGHEATACRDRDPHPRAAGLVDMVADLRRRAADCFVPIVAAEPAVPLPSPEPTPAPIAPPNRVALEKLAALNNVHFDLNADTISAVSAMVLDSVAAVLRGAPEIRAGLIGHTDPRGSIALNMRLGRRRAAAVLTYLARAGVDSSRLTMVSFGKSAPRAQGTGLREHALNRRVEIQYSGPDGVEIEARRQERDLQIERVVPKKPASGSKPPVRPRTGAEIPAGPRR